MLYWPRRHHRSLTGLPLLERKRRLRRILPAVESRLLYLDQIEQVLDVGASAASA